MGQRLIYWIFQRGKNCKHCCLWCEYYDLCRADVLAQDEREEKHGQERAEERETLDWTTKARLRRRYLAAVRISWDVCRG